LLTVTKGRVMPVMSSDDFSLHTEDCTEYEDGMPMTSFPDEVNSIDDLECECWSGFDSLAEAE
jgi:hypothetical protein